MNFEGRGAFHFQLVSLFIYFLLIKGMMIRGQWIWPGCRGHTSTLFERHPGIFNDYRQDLGLTSHPKDGA